MTLTDHHYETMKSKTILPLCRIMNMLTNWLDLRTGFHCPPPISETHFMKL